MVAVRDQVSLSLVGFYLHPLRNVFAKRGIERDRGRRRSPGIRSADFAPESSNPFSGGSHAIHQASNFMGKMSSKHSFIKKSEKEFVHKLEATMPGSPSPVTIFEVTCKK